MPNKNVQVLSPEQIDRLREAQEQLSVLQREIERAKLAGLDTAQFEESAAQLRVQVDSLLRVYG